MNRTRLLDRLRYIAKKIDAHERALDKLRADRLDLWRQGREADPPILHKELAEASGVTRPMVIRAVNDAASHDT